MAKFTLHAISPQGEIVWMTYDNQTSELNDADGNPIGQRIEVAARNNAVPVSKEEPGSKSSPRVLKIALGLSCNYECEYCSQRFVPHADETNPGDVQAFIDSMDSWVTSEPEKVEFWGGEPLVYIKTMRPLAEALRTKFPNVVFSVITNGSLLNAETNDWLVEMGFYVSVSHDGPGQHVRGPDPLQDPDRRAAILDLYQRLTPLNRFSFNAMLNRSNTSRAAIQRYFMELTGNSEVFVGEGAFVDAYDEGGIAQSLRPEDMLDFRNLAFHEIRTAQATNVVLVNQKISSLVDSICTGRPASSLGQKCGMDKSDSIAVDLRGNVLTCQNVSAASTAPNGQAHRIGHVSDLAGVKLNTATHWSKRSDCPSCPMLQICQGSCMFLEGLLWERSCDNAYSDAVPIFAAGIEFLTGCIPIYIEGDFREDRKDIFGLVNGAPDSPKKRVIPIQPVAT